jgi:hypothetical protein
MTGPAPKTRNWRARENEHEPSGLQLVVSGEVEVSATNKHPQLAEAPHVGKALPLDLTIHESGMGAQAVVWMAASFDKTVSADEFDRVEIRWDGNVIATAPVVDDSEHDTLAGKQVQAQNTVAKVKTGKAKKTPKKVAAVKTAKKAATKSAKKAPKKVAKKVAKKAAKKAAKKTAKKASKKKAPKSAFGKFVKKLVKKLTPKKAPKKKAKKSKKRR